MILLNMLIKKTWKPQLPTKVCEIKDGWFKSYGGAEKAALSTCQSPQKGEM